MDSHAVSFRVAKDDFAGAVGWVARSLPAKPAQPVLRGMLITAVDDGLELAGFDYEVSAQVKIPAEVSEPGRIAVAGRLLAEITAMLPNKPVDVRVESSNVLVTCGSSRFEIPIIPLDDYPQLPQLPQDTGSIDPKLFSEAVSQVAIAAGKDETLPMLTGVHMDIEGDNMLLAATDRFRLAVRTFGWNATDKQAASKLLIPAKTLLDTAKSIDSQVGNELTIAVGVGEQLGREGLFGLQSDARQTTTRMLDAEFPNFKPLLPKTHESMAVVQIAPLLNAIRRVSVVADRNSQIRMQFADGEVILSAGGSDAGHAEESLPCAFFGNPLTIAFNPGYLKEGLSVLHTENVLFGFTQPSRPAILIPEPENIPEADDNGVFTTPETDFTYLLMPVRLPG